LFKRRTHEHLFQTHRLRAELQTVAVVYHCLSALILHRARTPLPFPTEQLNSVFIVAKKFDNVTLPRYAKLVGVYSHLACYYYIPALLREKWVVRMFVKQRSVNGSPVVFPLLLNIY
jgi:hypothetical protein